MEIAEDLAIGVAAIGAGIVLSRQEAQLFDVELRDDVAEGLHPVAASGSVVGLLRKIAREADEVRFAGCRVDACDDVGEYGGSIRVRVAPGAPVGIRKLKEKEILTWRCRRRNSWGACRSS